MTFSLLSRSSYTIHLLMVRVRVFYIGFVFFTLAFCFFFFFSLPACPDIIIGSRIVRKSGNGDEGCNVVTYACPMTAVRCGFCSLFP